MHFFIYFYKFELRIRYLYVKGNLLQQDNLDNDNDDYVL